MASLRNAIPQRPYRERDQPNSRRRLGLLEKHKDYSARARDYNAKKARLKILRQKAADRNEDEFHFGMMSSRTRDGIKIAERGNKALGHDAVKLLKTQDSGYLKTMISQTRRERERLESEVQIREVRNGDGARLETLQSGQAEKGRSAKHTVFVDDETEQEMFDAEDWFQTDEQGLRQAYNRPRRRSSTNDEVDFGVLKETSEERKKRERQKDRTRAKLEDLKVREQQLLAAERELDLQRAKMNNTAGGITKRGVKFKVRERKK